jgi:hypothetical protein
MAALFKSFSVMVLYLILTAASSYGDVNFVEHIIDSHSYGNSSLYACDIDNDGDKDILGAVIENGDIVWWRNDGGNPITWEKIYIDYNVPVAFCVYAEDLDGDGHKDILGTSFSAHQVLWWKSSGQSPYTWTRHVIVDDYTQAHEVCADDLDDDGDMDVIGVSSGLSRVDLWFNEGGDPIQWTQYILDNNFGTAKSARPADINGDSTLDIMGAAIYGHDVVWWHNDGGNPITWTKFYVDGNFIGAHRVRAVDLDRDGRNDIVGAGYLGHEIAWWHNDGGDPITWTEQILESSFTNACIAMPGDINGDGFTDVAGTGQGNNQVAWWENDGNYPITWTKHLIDENMIRPWPLDLADLDGDGDLDVISGSSHQGSAQVKWYENIGTVGLKDENQSIPAKSLYSFNSPNPFNQSTDIVFFLPAEADVRISIYNLTGALIISDEMGLLSPETHRYSWDAGHLPTGIYFYRIEGTGIMGSGKMLLLK